MLNEAPVEPGQEEVTLSFTLDDSLTCVQFRVLAENPLTFRGIYLLSERGIYRDPLILAALILLASCLLLLYRARRSIRPEILITLAFASVWSSMPLTLPWLLNGHDMFFHYSRLFYLAQDLFTQLPVRIHSGLFRGFGYMNPTFYSEFFLYPFALLIRLACPPSLLSAASVLCKPGYSRRGILRFFPPVPFPKAWHDRRVFLHPVGLPAHQSLHPLCCGRGSGDRFPAIADARHVPAFLWKL